MGRLDGKIALITGTASGQGRAAAELFCAEGARVVGCDVNADGAAETARRVRADGGEMVSMAPVDISSMDGAAGWVADAIAAFGGIDILYNNASAPRVGPFEELTWDDWSFTIRNELDLIYTVTKAAWPHLCARGEAVIINTGSVSGYRGAAFAPQAAHGAAKGGVLALTRHLAAAGGPHRVRCNSISPGLTITDQIRPFLEDPSHPMNEMRRSHPLGRLGEPEDVARVALFLASADAAYLNAIDIVVDGGQSIIV
jgi:meso-butanediol dehydrogenase/(S,S)-butanediol dehydrogenase/diacetyl reductase